MRSLIKLRTWVMPVFVLILSCMVYAGEPQKPVITGISRYNDYSVFSRDEFALIEDNYLRGIKSDNVGLQTSCAYFLGEMKSERAVIPLLSLVSNGKTEEARIIAGISLYKVHSHRGMYRLKYLSVHDNSSLARNVFEKIYLKYIMDKRTFKEI